MAQLVRGGRHPGVYVLLTLRLSDLDRMRIEQSLKRSSADFGRVATSPSTPQVPSVIAKKTANGTRVSALRVMTDHTLIATIFLMTKAPITCETAVIDSILTPVGFLKRTLTYS